VKRLLDSKFRAGVSIVAVGFLLAACSGGSSSGETSSSEETSGAESATAAPEGQTFVYAAAGVPESLDVWATYQGDSSRTQMYEWGSKLVYYDASGLAGNGCEQLATTENVRPGLAESWSTGADGTLTFTLRQGVTSGAGNVMTADDVVKSWNRAVEKSGVVRFLANTVAKFKEEAPFVKVDDQTVQVNVIRPTALDVSLFSYPMFGVLDWTEIEAKAGGDVDAWLTTNTANFGPWVLESFAPGEETVYEENPNYWDADRRGNFDRMVIRNVSEASIRSQLISTGEVNFADRLSFQEYSELESAESVAIYNCVSANRDMLMLNSSFEAFDDPEVRKAISLGINREALVEGVYLGFATPSTTGLGSVYLENSDGLLEFGYDPDLARQILADKGVSDLAFTITASPTRPGAHAESIAVQIQAFMSDIGVTTDINIVPGGTEFSDLFFAGEYESLVYLEPPALADPLYSAGLYNNSESFQNTHGYNSARYDELLSELEQTSPGPERQELIREISDLTVTETPVVYLVERSNIFALGSDVTGLQNTPHGSLMVFQLSKS